MRRIAKAEKPVSELDGWLIKNGRMMGRVIDRKAVYHNLQISFSIIRMNLNEGWAESQIRRYKLLRRYEDVDQQRRPKKSNTQNRRSNEVLEQ